MTNLKTGDKVRLTHENGDVLSGEVTGFINDVHPEVRTIFGAHSINYLHNLGFREKVAKPALPTEPGLYFDKDEDLWELREGGTWHYKRRDGDSDLEPATYAPFERIYSLAEAAEVIAKYVEDKCYNGAPKIGYVTAIRNKFGNA